MKPHPSLCLVALIALLPATSAQAAVVAINNFANGTQSFAASLSGPDGMFFFPQDFPDREVAFTFVTGADPVYLTELAVSISIGGSALSPIQATLSTGSSVPGGVGSTIIGSWAPAASFPIGQVLSIMPTVALALAPSTTYWVHLTVPAGEGIYAVNNSNAPVYSPGWSLGNTWMYDPDGGWSELTSGPQAKARLTVEAVPEPSTALLLVALAPLLARRRRM